MKADLQTTAQDMARQDLCRHVRPVENDLLFPRAVEMARAGQEDGNVVG